MPAFGRAISKLVEVLCLSRRRWVQKPPGMRPNSLEFSVDFINKHIGPIINGFGTKPSFF